MALPLIPLLLGLAEVVPAIAGIFAGEKAQEKAEKIAGMVKAVTGKDDVAAGVEALRASPQLALQFQVALMQHERESYITETARLQVINETMRAEYASGDPYTRRWRPTFGYVAAFTWTVQGIIVFAVLGYTVVAHPDRTAATIAAVTELMRALADHWLYAMAVLGVAVWKRSEDKRAAAGQADYGVFGSLAARIRGASRSQ